MSCKMLIEWKFKLTIVHIETYNKKNVKHQQTKKLIKFWYDTNSKPNADCTNMTNN